jgi:predicted CXXCH cytochrome family protein
MGINYIILVLLFLFPNDSERQSFSKNPIEEGCIECHSDLTENSVVHPELESLCDICHTPTGEEHPGSSTKTFTLSEDLPQLCFNCHSDFQENMESFQVVHGPLTDSLSCINCHNPHSSQNQRLLINETNSLCLSCHNKTILKDSTSITNINQILTKAKSIHDPVETGECVTCHNPHFAEQRDLLVGSFPSGLYVKVNSEKFELCFMCHDSELLEALETEFGTSFRDGNKNLHFIHTNGDKGRNCTMCHDVHGATNDRLIIDKLSFGNWEMEISYETSANGGSCLTACHGEKQYDRTISKK